jgi:transcriptional regulator with XRE-family HTH domain
MSSKSINVELNKTIGAKLLRLRQIEGLSQQNVADDIGFSPTTYSKLENGKIDFTVTRLMEFANYFKVCASDFLDPDMDVPRPMSEVRPISEYRNLETKFEVLRELFGNAIK